MRPIALVASLLAVGGAAHAASTPAPVDQHYLAARGVQVPGTLVLGRAYTDRDGEHVLVLTRKTGPSPGAPSSGRAEYHALLATLHTRGADGAWRQSWTIRDVNDCPGLDSDAGFFASEVTFTDIDKDGRLEVTVPYRMFCGGGIEPATLKVILRQGERKLAIRGQQAIRFPRQTFGGEQAHDEALLAPRNAAFKRHLDAVWRKVVIDDRR
jgi:hypothetical protein